MTQPKTTLLRMVFFLGLVAAVVAVLLPGLRTTFASNPALNGLILGVLLFGVILNLRQVLLLRPEVAWVEARRRGQPALSGRLRLLAPMASMLGEPGTRISLSAMALRSLLDSIAARLDESRELARYMVGLLIFLGLLGTFWGLSQTVSSVGDIIRSLDVSGTDPAAMFDTLKSGLERPLGGMGTAFSTSLFGLAGSLVLGFLDLQAGRAQNTFYNELEEWLSTQTRLGSGALAEDQHVPAYIQALLEQTADSLDGLQRLIGRSEEGRLSANAGLSVLADRLSALTDQMRAESTLAKRESAGMDEATRAHIRSIDNRLEALLGEAVASRTELVSELRSEVRLLARTVAAAAAHEPAARS
ncbi:MAG: flagellar motor protein MotA [Magnetospirillum sp.]|nr:flagellar motor protein MotA [Magnetospirillum sp.]